MICNKFSVSVVLGRYIIWQCHLSHVGISFKSGYSCLVILFFPEKRGKSNLANGKKVIGNTKLKKGVYMELALIARGKIVNTFYQPAFFFQLQIFGQYYIQSF